MRDEELLKMAESSFRTANVANGLPAEVFIGKCLESIAASLLVIARSTPRTTMSQQDITTAPIL